MRCILIYNPAAGVKRERRTDEIGRAAARLRSLGHEVLANPTVGPGSAGEQARDAVRDGAEIVFACGGDGTVHEVLQGLVAETGNPSAVFGIVPLGSANVLARHLGIPLDAERAVEEQIRGERRTISVGKLEIGKQKHYFAVMAGTGPDGVLACEQHAAGKARWGRMAYYLRAARIFATHRFAHFAVEYAKLDGTVHTVQAVSAMTARVGSLGGLFTGLIERENPRGAAMDEQNLHVFLVRPPGYVSLPLWFLTGWLGLRRFNPLLLELNVRHLACRPLNDGDVPCEADGEWLGRIPIRVSVVLDSLNVLAPRR
jgi:diacylglycerol kinase family enzyme